MAIIKREWKSDIIKDIPVMKCIRSDVNNSVFILF